MKVQGKILPIFYKKAVDSNFFRQISAIPSYKMSPPEPTDPATGDSHTPTLPARLKKERIYKFINHTTETYAEEVYEGIGDTVENEYTTEE